MYHIALCDDTPEDIQLILAIVQRWAAARGTEIQTQTFSSAENFLFHYAEDKQYDILLLDVEMGEMDGVSLAKRLRQAKDPVQIVFITGYSDYIAEGYEVSALHYLMKPVREEKLMDVLDRAAQRLQVEERALFLKLEGELPLFLFQALFLPVSQIQEDPRSTKEKCPHRFIIEPGDQRKKSCIFQNSKQVFMGSDILLKVIFLCAEEAGLSATFPR